MFLTIDVGEKWAHWSTVFIGRAPDWVRNCIEVHTNGELDHMNNIATN
jgi:hypothetical protein